MAISINWLTKIITIPQADLTDLGGGLYQLDVDAFRLELKDIEDSDTGIVFLTTHNHNTNVTLSGVTYARTFEIINGYRIEFEYLGTPYTVICINANHNIADVKVVNQVSLIIGNAAGLIQVTSGSGVLPADIEDIAEASAIKVWDELKTTHSTASTYGKIVQDLETLIRQIKALTTAGL